MKYDRQKFCDASNKVKLDVIKTELGLVTHNGTTKDDLLMLLDWCYNRVIKGDLIQSEKEEHKGVEIDQLKGEYKEILLEIIHDFIVFNCVDVTIAICKGNNDLLIDSIKKYLNQKKGELYGEINRV